MKSTPTVTVPPYVPGDIVLYRNSAESEYSILRVCKVVRRGSYRSNSRRWVIYCDGCTDGLYEEELEQYVRAKV